MKTVKKVLLFLRDVIELYIPMVSFCLLFLAFVLQVVSRYVFNHPFTWTNDVIVLGFCWSVILGACYTMRKKGHVQFTMLYDIYKPKVAALLRLLGNVIIIATFICLVIPSVKFSIFQNFQKTAVLRISLTWVFLPFAYFLCSVIGYSIEPCVEDVKVLMGIIPDAQEHKIDADMKAAANAGEETK
ncbi:MAG: TRAP transporter small permease [Sphaerochaetaceae bacterium]|nr:TRAP transporter small permease [Candidatus Cloacimonadota bacterium]